MKTLQIILLALVVVLATAFTPPRDRMIIRMKAAEEGKSINIQLANLEGAHTKLSIIGVDGRPWHSQYLWGQNGYAAQLDLTLLEPGDYLIQVANRMGRVDRVFTLRDDGVTFMQPRGVAGPETPAVAFVAYRTREGRLIARFEPAGEPGKLDVQLANLLGRPVTISITSLQGIPVFEDQDDGVTGINRRLDLTDMADGNYFLYLNTARARVVQFFRLRQGKIKLLETVGSDTYFTPDPEERVTM